MPPPGEQFTAGALRSQSSSGSDLLYISDPGTNAVYVYSYPGGTLVQTLSGFDTPLRECSDSAGNVFITNTNSEQIVEYAHGGDAPIATLPDPKELPVDCAVDPRTNDLAVTNYGQKGSYNGSLSLYSKSKGKAKKLHAPGVLAYLFCVYDDRGNLYATGLDYKYNLVFIELPKGKKAFVKIALKKAISGWGAVQWDGKYVTIGDGAATVYRFAIKNQTAKLVDTIGLKGALNVVGYLLDGNRLIGPDGPNGGGHDVGIWRYPAGGGVVSKIKGAFTNPSGVALSPGASR